jgi:SAM-dependent MidA family methyltransferase
VDVFAVPGESDLTAHVDFELLGKTAQRQGAQRLGVQMQGEWLTALGIDMRMEALRRRAPDQAEKIARQHARLVAEDQMGLLFKVMGLSGKGWPAEAPGF